MNTSGKILVALAAGIAAGTVLGILFAPGKGSETRRRLKEKGKDFADSVKDNLQKGKEKINAFKEDMEKKMKEHVEEFS